MCPRQFLTNFSEKTGDCLTRTSSKITTYSAPNSKKGGPQFELSRQLSYTGPGPLHALNDFPKNRQERGSRRLVVQKKMGLTGDR